MDPVLTERWVLLQACRWDLGSVGDNLSIKPCVRKCWAVRKTSAQFPPCPAVCWASGSLGGGWWELCHPTRRQTLPPPVSGGGCQALPPGVERRAASTCSGLRRCWRNQNLRVETNGDRVQTLKEYFQQMNKRRPRCGNKREVRDEHQSFRQNMWGAEGWGAGHASLEREPSWPLITG